MPMDLQTQLVAHLAGGQNLRNKWNKMVTISAITGINREKSIYLSTAGVRYLKI
jgi:hypothetical protein